MHLKNKKIFWDMDETLGFFRHVHYELTNKELPDFPKFGTKEGIEDLLKEINESGAENFIVSNSGDIYAEEVLKRTNLKKYFKDFFYGVGLPKHYFKILEKIGVPREKSGEDVLIIGDKIYDSPADARDIVTILDYSNYLRNAELTRIMINMLAEEGKGNFKKGFYKMYTENPKISSGYAHLPEISRIFLENGTELNLNFNHERDHDTGAPIFEVKKANFYYNMERWKTV